MSDTIKKPYDDCDNPAGSPGPAASRAQTGGGMRRAGLFGKVSVDEFIKHASKEAYLRVRLPVRATAGSAGYDFVTPVDITLEPGESAVIPTGIQAQMAEGVVLLLFPRSGLGFSHGMRLANTTGVIDSDYWQTPNQGHILVRIVNGDAAPLRLKAGDRFCQGVFLPFLLTLDDEPGAERAGGIGSTGL
ncbi:MAG: dUTP diphosphatase [Clostridia bacterium]|nr:dUTP diphosphatase [Clostridia bacterium]